MHTEYINHKGRIFVHVAEETQLFTVKVTITVDSRFDLEQNNIILFCSSASGTENRGLL